MEHWELLENPYILTRIYYPQTDIYLKTICLPQIIP